VRLRERAGAATGTFTWSGLAAAIETTAHEDDDDIGGVNDDDVMVMLIMMMMMVMMIMMMIGLEGGGRGLSGIRGGGGRFEWWNRCVNEIRNSAAMMRVGIHAESAGGSIVCVQTCNNDCNHDKHHRWHINAPVLLLLRSDDPPTLQLRDITHNSNGIAYDSNGITNNSKWLDTKAKFDKRQQHHSITYSLSPVEREPQKIKIFVLFISFSSNCACFARQPLPPLHFPATFGLCPDQNAHKHALKHTNTPTNERRHKHAHTYTHTYKQRQTHTQTNTNPPGLSKSSK